MARYTSITSTSTASDTEAGGTFRRDAIHEQASVGVAEQEH